MSKERRALIGFSGFVGSNLPQHEFSDHFNSKNISSIAGQDFDLVVCSGITATKWKANKNPQEDWELIQSLFTQLKTVKAARFVLISTVDVYDHPQRVDENTVTQTNALHAYGLNRLRAEEFIRNQFQSHHIVRLPGLFGKGLKKNVIFDLLNNNCLDVINPSSSFQYFNLEHLWTNILRVMEVNLPLVNICSEPIATFEILNRFFPDRQVGSKASPEVHYDINTAYSSVWGKTGPYQYLKDEVLNEMEAYIRNYKRVL